MRVVRSTIFVATALLVAGCSQADQPTPRIQTSTLASIAAPKPVVAQSFDGTVVLSARLEGGSKPAVVGLTNLPDGTKLLVTLSRKQSAYSAQDKAVVAHGVFRAGPFSQQGSALNPGKYTIEVGTPLAALQPANVRAAFGANGENLKGPIVAPSPFGGTVVDYSTRASVAGKPNGGLDSAARARAEQELHEWYVGACDDQCRIVNKVAVKEGKPFDQNACKQQCLVEIPGTAP